MEKTNIVDLYRNTQVFVSLNDLTNDEALEIEILCKQCGLSSFKTADIIRYISNGITVYFDYHIINKVYTVYVKEGIFAIYLNDY